MICLDKLRQTYMLAALNIKEACSKQNKEEYDDVSQYNIVDLVIIKNFDKKLNWDAKDIPYFGIIRLIGPRQLEVSNLPGRLLKTKYL